MVSIFELVFADYLECEKGCDCRHRSLWSSQACDRGRGLLRRLYLLVDGTPLALSMSRTSVEAFRAKLSTRSVSRNVCGLFRRFGVREVFAIGNSRDE